MLQHIQPWPRPAHARGRRLDASISLDAVALAACEANPKRSQLTVQYMLRRTAFGSVLRICIRDAC